MPFSVATAAPNGRRGGQASTPAKRKAARANGRRAARRADIEAYTRRLTGGHNGARLDVETVDAVQRIRCGDARVLVPTLDPSALIVTDPPYNVGVTYEVHNDRMPEADYEALLGATLRPPCVVITYPEALPRLARILGDPTKVVAWVYPANTARQFRTISWFGCAPDFQRGEQAYRNPGDWRVQTRIASGETARLYDWWHIDLVKNVSREKTPHPAQTPTEVMTRILTITPADFIVDPFCGSGTTLVAAQALGRAALGMDISPAYCALATARLTMTPKEAPCWLDENPPAP
jgi:hypothetical protein